MNTSDNVVFLGVNAVSRRDRELLKRIQANLEERVLRCLTATLEQADDALFDRAQRAVSDAHQEAYFVAMRQVRLNRQAMADRFSEALDSTFRRLAFGETGRGGGGDSAPSAAASLELMDNAAVEEEVAVDTTVRRVRGRTTLSLAQIEARLQSMVDGGQLIDGANPLEPRAVVNAFSQSVGVVVIEIQPRVILYKLFEKQLLAVLPPLYEEINREFAAAGVLPDLKPGQSPRAAGARHDRAGTRSPADSDAAAPATGGAAWISESGANDGEVVRMLHALIAEAKGDLAGDATFGGYADDGGDSAADPRAVVGVLSSLQQSVARSGARRLDAARLKDVITRGLHRSGAEERLGRPADDTIDIVSMLFDMILEDPRLHDSIKALIARLQIPVLKVALLDRAFFGSRGHPARRLINALSHAAIGWNEPDDPQSDPLFRKMQEVVDRVVECFADDAGVFESALRDFQAFQASERERADIIEDRTRQAAEGKARVDDARQRVQAEIESRVAGDETLPTVVVHLLEQAWFKVLFITAVKEGTDGDAWETNITVMDRLLWSVRPKPDGTERRRMLNEMPALLQDLREGLNGIMFNPFEMTRLFRELEAEHLRLLSEPTPPPSLKLAPGARDEAPTPPCPAPEPAPDADAGVTDDPEIAAELRSTPLGTWFEFLDESGNRTRAKLSARLSDGLRYIFVNRAGFKVADRTLAEVVADIVAARASPVDDNELFDRALENVITNLRQMRAGRSV